jgi:hypothetical protein
MVEGTTQSLTNKVTFVPMPLPEACSGRGHFYEHEVVNDSAFSEGSRQRRESLQGCAKESDVLFRSCFKSVGICLMVFEGGADGSTGITMQ